MLENDLHHTLKRLREHALIKSALARLRAELPKDLFYHSYEHTEDVLSEVVRFALIDGLSDREIELLGIAAAFHDIGFLTSRVCNEGIGAQEARTAMTGSGAYTEDEITLVSQMILDTALLQTPNGPQRACSTPLSSYLLDADLSTLGRDDFFSKGELLRQEFGQDQDSFRQSSLVLLNSHTWLTEAARSLRQAKKDENVAALREMLQK